MNLSNYKTIPINQNNFFYQKKKITWNFELKTKYEQQFKESISIKLKAYLRNQNINFYISQILHCNFLKINKLYIFIVKIINFFAYI